MTDTERDDVLKKRQSRIEDVKVGISNLPDNIIGNIRSFEITAKVTIQPTYLTIFCSYFLNEYIFWSLG